MLLVYNSRFCKFTKLPMEDGMLPVILLAFK
jgi:hypothetical protein